ncbi:MAG TPA: bifunctional hydroxymethylpyrimidine kinase/phosphomethylpyrimidine kinase, partial [Cellulomonas sp.]|uniref:bifunctional hydroxymethylpyrimidine kinase/phosphomethylpyrimidine kinase n=1 Tax=Cellulomonas sp. TaxID=40001 RepID=UPI002E375DFF
NALTIAGTDPSGGAGIQADLKTFSALGVYGMTVVTALTAQNTQGVAGIHPVPGEFVTAQLESLFDDVRIDTVKIGMLGTAEVIEAVAAALRRYRPACVVLDPVMVASTGDVLLAPEAIATLRDALIPLVDLITPNVAEAAVLLGEPQAVTGEDAADQLGRLGELCPGVLLTGGHLDGPQCADFLSVDGTTTRIDAARVMTRNTHGTGCTLSAAIAALRPGRPDWTSAVRDAKGYLTAALLAADTLDVGRGPGPVHHFHALWPPSRAGAVAP